MFKKVSIHLFVTFSVLLVAHNTFAKDNSVYGPKEFADKNKFPMEFVHEVFDAISPYYEYERESFKLDIIDELYDFPKELTEASRVLFSLGRRDTKLEYLHKALRHE